MANEIEIRELLTGEKSQVEFLPVNYRGIKFNRLLIPKSKKYYAIKLETIDGMVVPFEKTKRISKIIDFDLIPEI